MVGTKDLEGRLWLGFIHIRGRLKCRKKLPLMVVVVLLLMELLMLLLLMLLLELQKVVVLLLLMLLLLLLVCELGRVQPQLDLTRGCKDVVGIHVFVVVKRV